jgi:lipopolysaccharide export system permease protein
MRTLDKYILREHISPFFMGFGVVTFILTLDLLYDYLDLLIGKGIAPVKVLQLFVLGLGWMIALSVPCGVLVAALMAFGRLSQDNEISALRAGGINLIRVLLPPGVAAAVVAVLLGLFNNYVLPETNHAFATLLYEISQKKPTVQLKPGIFIDDFDGYTMYIGRLDDRSGKMENVMIYDRTSRDRPPTTVVAKTGWASFTADRRTLTLELHEGEIHSIPDSKAPGKYRRTLFKTHVINIPADKGALRSRRLHRGQRELSAGALLAEAQTLREQKENVEQSLYRTLSSQGYNTVQAYSRSPGTGVEMRGGRPAFSALAAPLWVAYGLSRPGFSPPAEGTLKEVVPARERRQIQSFMLEKTTLQKRINGYLVEVHKKFSVPFACIVFVFVGGPLGMMAKKSGPAIGFASILFFIFYYLCLLGGETLSDRGLLQPWFAMWAPNIALGVAGVVLVIRSCQIVIGGRGREDEGKSDAGQPGGPGGSSGTTGGL